MHPLLLHIDYWAVKMSLTYSTCGFIKICGAASCCCCWRKQLPKTSKTKWILGCAVCFSWGAKNATVFFLIISHKHNFLFDLMEMFCCVVYCMMCIINENQHIKSGSDNKAHFLLVSTWSWQDFFFLQLLATFCCLWAATVEIFQNTQWKCVLWMITLTLIWQPKCAVHCLKAVGWCTVNKSTPWQQPGANAIHIPLKEPRLRWPGAKSIQGSWEGKAGYVGGQQLQEATYGIRFLFSKVI